MRVVVVFDPPPPMPRSPRIEFAEAMDHVLVRGNRREPVVFGDDDWWMFLRTLGYLADLPRNDERNPLLAHILMERTSVPQKWIVEQLAMGSAPYVSRLAKEVGQRIETGDRAMKRLKKEIVARVITCPEWHCYKKLLGLQILGESTDLAGEEF